MRNARRAALLPVAVAVGGVLLASAPAYATVRATWSKPTDNSTYTTASPVDFAASLDRGGSTLTSPDGTAVRLTLTVPGPQPGPYTVDTSTGSSDRDLKFTLTPGCANYAGACPDGGAAAYNGRYTATMTGGASGTRTVVLQIPPAAPTGVTAAATGQHRVRVSWAANREPDTTGYDVFTADGTSVAANLPAASTSYEFDLPSSGYGGDHTYVVRAHRLACANCTGDASTTQLDSPMSQPATVTLNEPTPSPEPSDPGTGTGSGSGSGTGSGNGSGNGGGTDPGGYNGGGPSGGPSTGPGNGANPGQDANGYNTGNGGTSTYGSGAKPADPGVALAKARMAFGLTFRSFSPKLGAPKLPPLPKFDPQVSPLDDAYDPMLEYGDQTVTVPEQVASGGGFTTTLQESFSAVFEGRKLFRSIAIALLLLLAAGHLRVWLRTTPSA